MIRVDCYWHSEEPDMGARLHMCGMQKGIEPLESCDGCESYHSIRKPTNADRIRAMTDEELADLLEKRHSSPWCTDVGEACAYAVGTERYGKCWICALDWLKQEATK